MIFKNVNILLESWSFLKILCHTSEEVFALTKEIRKHHLCLIRQLPFALCSGGKPHVFQKSKHWKEEAANLFSLKAMLLFFLWGPWSVYYTSQMETNYEAFTSLYYEIGKTTRQTAEPAQLAFQLLKKGKINDEKKTRCFYFLVIFLLFSSD